jgi:polyhydroxyalkanoate synthesis regulator phasin
MMYGMKELYEDLQELVNEALERGASNIEEVRSYVTQYIHPELATTRIVKTCVEEIYGPMEE